MTRPLSAEMLGTIAFARFLSMPLKTYDRYVQSLEASAAFAALAPWTQAGLPEGCRVARADHAPLSSTGPIPLGWVREGGGRLDVLYLRTGFAREYCFDETGLEGVRKTGPWPRDWAMAVHRMRLVNSRNRLTRAVVRNLLDIQAEYLRSGDVGRLKVLSQAELSRRLTNAEDLPLVADPGRLSRLVRALSLGLMNGKTVCLSSLFPSERLLNCHRLGALMQREKQMMARGRLETPWTDEDIARILNDTHGMRLSRRTVTAIRHQMVIPDHRHRSDCKNYLSATEGFSPLVPLTPQTVASLVPTHSGIYEIRSPSLFESTNTCPSARSPSDPSQVIYIGSTQDLRKRLSDHLRGNGSNSTLYKYLLEEVTRVRFRVINDGWREAERQLYRVFCETFGAPPPCNRMSP